MFNFKQYLWSVCLSLYHVDIDSVIVTQSPSNVPVIGSTKEYTITCDVTVSCIGLCSDTLTISWSLNGNSVNSTNLTDLESNNSPFAVSSSGNFTSTLTTVGDISLSHAGQYKCTAGKSRSNTTDFDVKCKLNTCTSTITIINILLIYFDSTCPFNYCY